MAEANLHHVRVSPGLFELATDCIRLCSNRNRRLASISDVVAEGTPIAQEMLRDDPASLRDHLATMPASGLIAITFGLDAASQGAFKTLLSKARPLMQASNLKTEALSLLLFAYLVDCRAAVAADALLKRSEPMSREKDERENTVLPFARS